MHSQIVANDVFVTGTDTNVGKTVLSALLCAALRRHYWKPIQTGTVEGTDRETVIRLAEISERETIAETYRFTPPVSPHLAARLAETRIDLDSIVRPRESTPLVIEGAGGVLVPINEHDLMIDLMARLAAPVVLATRTALGTINHTLLSVKALRDAGLTLKGVIMIGEQNAENRNAVERYGSVEVIGWIPMLPRIDRAVLIDVYNRHFSPDAFV